MDRIGSRGARAVGCAGLIWVEHEAAIQTFCG